MESVKLQVNVVRGQLNTLISDVKKLQTMAKEPIKITIDTNGIERADKKTTQYINALARLKEAEASATTANNQASAAAAKQAAAQTKQTTTTKEATKATVEATKSNKLLGDSIGNVVAKMAAWQVIGAAVSKVLGSFKDALNTMKAVDSEMVAVQKVTNFTQSQMEEIEQTAYSMATKYGASASDYMAGVANYARAGYMENSVALAELSTKTQIVGDTTQEVADQFLLSMDAAYKYHGSIEKLTQVLDGADIINNRYATSLEKIAEGLGIVAPVAAQMKVSEQELTAALGTITAVTQRSGSEAARALRAIFLNIVGDTKTEIDEGVTWTTGEIEGLRDVIKQFAPEAYKMAQATGDIIDPMVAIGGLAESMEKGLLTEQKLMEMVSDIGGKLRASQLLALIQNWDMYESMMQDYANAAGTADKEIELAMNSWERKANRLKNTFTEMVKSFISSDFIKGLLTTSTNVLKLINSLGGLSTVLVGIISLLIAIKGVDAFSTLKTKVDSFKLAIKAAGTETATFATKTLLVKGALTAAALAFTIIYALIQRHKQAMEEARQAAEQALQTSSDRIKSLEDMRKQYLEIIDSEQTEAEKTAALDAWKNTLISTYGVEEAALRKVNQERETGIDLIKAETQAEIERAIAESSTQYDAAKKKIENTDVYSGGNIGGGGLASVDSRTLAYLKQAGVGIEKIGSWAGADTVQYDVAGKDQIERTESLAAAIAYLSAKKESLNGLSHEEEAILSDLQSLYKSSSEIVEKYGDIYNEHNAMLAKRTILQSKEYDALVSTTASAEEKADAYDALSRKLLDTYGSGATYAAGLEYLNLLLGETKSSTNDLTDAENNHKDSTEDDTAELWKNTHALDENATAADREKAAKADAEAAVRKHISALFNEKGELTAEGKAALASSEALRELVSAELSAQLAAAQANYAHIRAELAAVSTDALKAARALIAFNTAAAGPAQEARDKGFKVGNLGLSTDSLTGEELDAYKLLKQLEAAQAEIDAINVQVSSVNVAGGGSGSGGGGGSGSGGGGGSGSGGGGGSSGGSGSSSKSSTDTKLQALKDAIALLQSQLNLLQEQDASEEDQIAKMREIQNALHAEAEYLRSIGGSEKDIVDLQVQWMQYQNKILDLQKATTEQIEKAVDAQLALNRAQSERTVRIYNAATGQWEWVADPSSLRSAQESYDEATSGMSAETLRLINQTAAKNLIASGESAAAKAAAAMMGLTSSFGTAQFGSTGGAVHNGNNYYLNGIQLSRQQAEVMSIAQLARQADVLAIYANH